MKTITLFLLISISFNFQAYCQEATDTLIYAEGKIVNGETQEPVTAKITYQSLPFANKIGVIHNTSYSFPMFSGEKYSVVVEAPGFAPVKYLLDPAEANENKKVVKDVELYGSAPKHNHDVGHVMRLNHLIFQLGKAKISSESYSELDLVVKMMRENANMVIQLEGHTDYQGDPAQNMKLSQMRVDAVKSYLVSKGVHRNRIRTKAFGGTMPLSKDDTPQAHALNRRVEVRILEN